MLNPDGPDQLKPGSVSPQAVILAPTRELAQQIEVEAQKLLHRSGHLSACVYGGAKANAQLSELAKGVTVLVATPGRLQDFVDRGLVALSSVRFLVLDEADRMLDMGFEPQMRRIVERSGMPSKTARQTLMFSATFPPEMQKLAADFLGEYVWIAVGRVGSTTKNIEQRIVRADSSKQLKMPLLVAALAEVNGRTLVFVKKKATANWVAKQLKRAAVDGGAGIDAAEIHGDRSQSQRESALAHFKEGSVRVLVATDVAARGLDIEQVAHVINFDLGSTKDDFDSYVHRIGRTGRAGHTGIATSFYTPGFDPKSGCGPIAHDLVKFLQETGQPIPAWLPALPELAGGGGGASGGKKDAVQRDVRDHRDQVSRPMSARADLRPQTGVQASAAQRAPQQAQGGQTPRSARGGLADTRDRGGRGGGGGGGALRADAGVGDARRDLIARPSTAGAEQRPQAGIQAGAAQRAPQQAISVGVEGAGRGGPAVGRGFAHGVVGLSGRGGGAAVAVAVAGERAHEDAREQREVVGRGRGRGRGDGRVLPVDSSAGGRHRDSLDAAPPRGGNHGRGRHGAVRGGSDQAARDS
jgi:ATP-dependent RNA helicase DDX3X